MFNSPEQYERFLKLQEEQIRIAREQIELQKSLNMNQFHYFNTPLNTPVQAAPQPAVQSPVSPYQKTGLLMPFQQSPTFQQTPTPPQVIYADSSKVQPDISQAVQRINEQQTISNQSRPNQVISHYHAPSPSSPPSSETKKEKRWFLNHRYISSVCLSIIGPLFYNRRL